VPPPYTAFYAATGKVAEEIRRLLEEGALDRLVAILREAGLRLELEAFSPGLAQAEYLGELEPGEGEGEERYEYEDFLAARVEQRISLPGGEEARVAMPDHVCPFCGNDLDNFIVDTQKTCVVCKGTW